MDTNATQRIPLRRSTLLLGRSDVAELLDIDTCIAAVESALLADALGHAIPAGVLSARVDGGGFHVKGAGLRGGEAHYATKINSNFPKNRECSDLPTIQGVVTLFDARDGRLLALMDSAEVTSLRTGASTAIAARHLARADSRLATVIGCGVQGRAQLRALARVLPLARVLCIDVRPDVAAAFAREMSALLEIPVEPARDIPASLRRSDVCVTCTTSDRPLIAAKDLRPGTFVAAVGADAECKNEIEPGAMASAKVVCDSLEQCAAFGDTRHAIAAGVLSRSDVYGELKQLVAGELQGRSSPDEVTIYDSTGTAIQDVGAALAAYQRALEKGNGEPFRFGD